MLNLTNTEYEKCLLGSMLIEDMDIDTIVLKVDVCFFSEPQNKTLFESIIDLKRQGIPTNIIELSKHCPNISKGYIASLTDTVSSAANWEFYANELKKLYTTRELKQSLKIAEEEVSPETITETFNSIDKKLFDLRSIKATQSKKISDLCYSLLNSVEDAFKNKIKLLGVDTGWECVNDISEGLQLGELTILGARPSIGKTAFALQLAANICKQNIRCCIFSLEMSAESLCTRMASAESGVSIRQIRYGQCLYSPAMAKRLQDGLEVIYKMPLDIYDEDVKDEEVLISAIKQEHKTKGTKVFFVDHLGLLPSTSKNKKRFEQLDEMTHKFQKLAQQLHISIICLCQLRRDSEGKVPTLSDLRDSGAIEQNADVCMFLHRDRSTGIEEEIKTQLIFIKNRNGNCGTANLLFVPKFTKFIEERKNENRFDNA